jgi:hypothetical protein
MENQQLYNLPVPPTDVLFDSMKDILEYCQNFSKTNGYAVATKNSIPDKRIYKPREDWKEEYAAYAVFVELGIMLVAVL